VTAEEQLRRSGLDSAELRGLVLPVAPERMTVRPAPAIMRRLWGQGIQAMTIRTRIYVDPAFLAGHERPLGLLVVHELAHARQWADLGTYGFLKRYLSAYLKGRLRGLGHRDAYLAIDLEVEARALVDRFR
jgi:hypothetical protein